MLDALGLDGRTGVQHCVARCLDVVHETGHAGYAARVQGEHRQLHVRHVQREDAGSRLDEDRVREALGQEERVLQLVVEEHLLEQGPHVLAGRGICPDQESLAGLALADELGAEQVVPVGKSLGDVVVALIDDVHLLEPDDPEHDRVLQDLRRSLVIQRAAASQCEQHGKQFDLHGSLLLCVDPRLKRVGPTLALGISWNASATPCALRSGLTAHLETVNAFAVDQSASFGRYLR